jgi:hypothetical protein
VKEEAVKSRFEKKTGGKKKSWKGSAEKDFF